jgi:hypothetical protein
MVAEAFKSGIISIIPLKFSLNAPKLDAFMEASIGGIQDFAVPLQRATIATAALAGEVWVADYEDRELVGVAAWYGPGRTLLDGLVPLISGNCSSMRYY